MSDLFNRCHENPILRPESLQPSMEGLSIECLLNPGTFRYNGMIGLVARVAERPQQKEGIVSFPVLNEAGQIELCELDKNMIDEAHSDARVVRYQNRDYLTTMSHLRVLWSRDGVHFEENKAYPRIVPSDKYTAYGIEDCRVAEIDGVYYLTFTAVSENGVAVGMKSTTDWVSFKDHGLIFPPHNKDCALFEEKINGKYYALHRPSSPEIGGNYMWIAESEDLEHWGNHRCIARTREGAFDSVRLGAGASPIKTEHGWLEIYHGATQENRYCLGAMLLDLSDPGKVLARSEKPIMMPTEQYEREGFFGEVIFTNGHVVDGDRVVIYYGAADNYICSASVSVKEILKSLLE